MRLPTVKPKTAQAANNIDVNTGSAVDVRASEREADVLDTATVLSNAELEAYARVQELHEGSTGGPTVSAAGRT